MTVEIDMELAGTRRLLANSKACHALLNYAHACQTYQRCRDVGMYAPLIAPLEFFAGGYIHTINNITQAAQDVAKAEADVYDVLGIRLPKLVY